MMAKDVVIAYWLAMESNDFYAAARWLAEDFECYWPQSNELIVGRENFAALNTAYPSEGQWRFTIERIVQEGNQVVTDVVISDGQREDRALTFHTVENGLIRRQTEYWPERYEAPAWRAQWVQRV
jgi:limonene-1,2-epoxide hydrolase